jgi:riboflavin kinase/FMN adenylyltransferase
MAQPKPCVLTIGNFDGMHRGHQLIVEQVIRYAKAHHLVSIAMMFEPQPREFFKPDDPLPRLSLLRDKLAFLNTTEIDYCLCLPFNKKLASLSAEQFIENILVKKLNVKHLIVGDDFAFGSDRKGNFTMLEQYGKRFGFSVEHTPSIMHQSKRISSSWLRQLMLEGDFSQAEKLLGRPYRICGRVQHGDKRGRLLGFPTLNIRLVRPMAVRGVYLVKVYGLNDKTYYGVANVGRRPTVDGTVQLLEVFLLDYSGECYGKLIQVEFIHYIRGEQKFSSIEALKHQIALDVENAKKLI